MSGSNSPPTAPGVPLLGNGLAFSRDPFGSIEAWGGEGPVVRLTFPGRTIHMVTDPALVEQVLVERQSSFTIGRDQREAFAGVEDDAITSTTGDRWRHLRRGLHPAFTWDGISGYGGTMAAVTAQHVDGWNPGDRFDLHREMRHLTLHILGETLLGVDMAGREEVVFEAADALVDRDDPRRFGQLLPRWVPTPTERRFRRGVDRLDGFVADALDDGSPGEGDVRSVLLAAHERGDLTMAEVRDNLTALLLGGHDSAAVALTYAWLELSRNPAVRASLGEEVGRVVGDGLPTIDEFDDLTRTRNVLRETLRLYPPAWATNREAREDVTLGGYDIEAGSQVMLPQWVLHRDERFWDDPGTFDPTRWERDADRPEYAYFPFSGGPRHCIGMRFARLELAMALATMVARADLDVSVDGELTFVPSPSLRPETDIDAVVRTP